MSKDKIQLLSPLFLKYQADYEKNPRSRVFAPLAETYRKLGMTDKAMEILSQGIRFHPGYVMGYLGLAFCYYDIKQFTLAYNTLRPLVDTSRDNIRLQKLFADVCLELNYKQEALDTYKYLLFINPRDRDVAIQVATLESLIEEQFKPVHQPIYIPESDLKTEVKKSYNDDQLFDIDKLDNKPNSSKADFDDWMALDLSREQKVTKTEDPYEFWNLKKGETNLDAPVTNLQESPVEKLEEKPRPSTLIEIARAVKQEPVEVIETKIHVELDLDDDDDEDLNSSTSQKVPMVTHTLVDLYCGQGHMEKALEVLEKILILNPHDERTINKISEIKSLMGHLDEEMPEEKIIENKTIKEEELVQPASRSSLKTLEEASEEDGRKTLMSLIDQQVGPEVLETAPIQKQPARSAAKEAKTPKKSHGPSLEMQKKQLLEEKLNKFLKKIQKRALDYQARL